MGNNSSADLRLAQWNSKTKETAWMINSSNMMTLYPYCQTPLSSSTRGLHRWSMEAEGRMISTDWGWLMRQAAWWWARTAAETLSWCKRTSSTVSKVESNWRISLHLGWDQTSSFNMKMEDQASHLLGQCCEAKTDMRGQNKGQIVMGLSWKISRVKLRKRQSHLRQSTIKGEWTWERSGSKNSSVKSSKVMSKIRPSLW